jgi:hypothetical protein
MLDRKSLKAVAMSKLKAAKILQSANDFNTAGYLLGYVVDCALKACICKRLNLSVYPDSGKHHDVFSSHDLDRLLVLSGHSEEIDLSKNKDLFNNWSTLTKDWKTSVRYDEKTYNQRNIDEKIIALEDQTTGFLAWVRKKW